MKDLIAVFTYCPDTNRKLILNELLEQLQTVRDKFDILVVSHSELPSTTSDLSDYSFIESENKLLYDFDLRNRFWFRTEKLFVHSSLVYQFSTHLAIYSLIHYAINFAKYKGYKKIHCIEYDLKITNMDLINQVNNHLDKFDNVMFRSNDGWLHGTYFAFRIENFPEEYYRYSYDFILDELRTTETNMTEHYTPKFLSVNNRTTHFEPLESITEDVSIQKKDSHNNNELNWCVPVIEKDTDNLYFFLYNEKGGEYDIDIIYNSNHINFSSNEQGIWKIFPIGKLSDNHKLLILVNKKIKHDIIFNDENRVKFTKHNFFYWK